MRLFRTKRKAPAFKVIQTKPRSFYALRNSGLPDRAAVVISLPQSYAEPIEDIPTVAKKVDRDLCIVRGYTLPRGGKKPSAVWIPFVQQGRTWAPLVRTSGRMAWFISAQSAAKKAGQLLRSGRAMPAEDDAAQTRDPRRLPARFFLWLMGQPSPNQTDDWAPAAVWQQYGSAAEGQLAFANPRKARGWERLKHEDFIPVRVLAATMAAGIPAFLEGPPGVAKTTIIADLAKNYGWEVVYVPCAALDAADVAGTRSPEVEKTDEDPELGRIAIGKSLASFWHGIVFDKLKKIKEAQRQAEAEGRYEDAKRLAKKKVVVVLDEVPDAPIEAKAAMQEFLRTGKLPALGLDFSDTIRVGTGNPADITTGEGGMSAPLRTRLAIIPWGMAPGWFEWLQEKNVFEGTEIPEPPTPDEIAMARSYIIAFLQNEPGYIIYDWEGKGNRKVKDEDEDKPLPTPRSWANAANVLAVVLREWPEEDIITNAMAALVGEKAAGEFVTFLSNRKLSKGFPTPEEIIEADGMNPLPPPGLGPILNFLIDRVKRWIITHATNIGRDEMGTVVFAPEDYSVVPPLARYFYRILEYAEKIGDSHYKDSAESFLAHLGHIVYRTMVLATDHPEEARKHWKNIRIGEELGNGLRRVVIDGVDLAEIEELSHRVFESITRENKEALNKDGAEEDLAGEIEGLLVEYDEGEGKDESKGEAKSNPADKLYFDLTRELIPHVRKDWRDIRHRVRACFDKAMKSDNPAKILSAISFINSAISELERVDDLFNRVKRMEPSPVPDIERIAGPGVEYRRDELYLHGQSVYRMLRNFRLLRTLLRERAESTGSRRKGAR